MRTLRPVRPPIAVEREYHKRIKALFQKMNRSLFWWLRAEYRKVDTPQVNVQDGSMTDVQKKLKQLHKYWSKAFEKEADVLGEWFGNAVQKYTTTNLKNQMKKSKLETLGFDLKFSYHSRKERDVLKAIIMENVRYITNIGEDQMGRAEGVILRGIENGYDLSTMSENLEETFGVSERKASMIARDQTRKATNSLSRQRLLDYGVTKGKWMHTSAGKTYRDSHVAMDGTIYDIEQGCFDDDYGEYIQPAELPNCHCVCIPVLDFSKEDEFWSEYEGTETGWKGDGK